MADEPVTDTAKPLDHIAKVENEIDAPGGHSKPVVDPVEPTSAGERLRAFEDEHFGPHVVRIRGNIERGSGSPYQKMTTEQRRQHDALEKLIVAEQKLADAHAALLQAEADHEAAIAATEPRPDADAAE